MAKKKLNKKDTTSDRMAQYLGSIDFKMLKGQKTTLINIQSKLEKPKAKFTQKEIDALEGIICLIDSIQDVAVDEYGHPERTVFRRSRD